MKNSLKFILFFIAIISMLFIIPSFSNAATPVTDEESLNNAISSADVGATVTLQNNITVTKPIVIAKELTIDGNGFTVTGSSDWISTSGNQTMFTAQFSAAKLILLLLINTFNEIAIIKIILITFLMFLFLSQISAFFSLVILVTFGTGSK